MPTSSPWWETFFDDDYRRLAAPMLTKERTEEEVEALLTLLSEYLPGAPAPLEIIDVCGGAARIALPLSRCGHMLTVADLSESMLRAGMELRDQEPVAFAQVDARALPWREGFDAALNLFSSIGYFEDDEEHVAMLQSIAESLRPGGVLIMGLTHRDHFVRDNSSGQSWYLLEDGTPALRSFYFDPIEGVSHETLQIIVDEQYEAREWRCRLFTATEIAHMLRRAGLEPEGWYGSFALEPFSAQSPRLIVVARKAGDHRTDRQEGGSVEEGWRGWLNSLSCPVDHTPLQLMDDTSLGEFNEAIASGKIQNVAGEVVSAPVDAALVRQDGIRAYPVRGDLPMLLDAEALLLP